MEESSQFQGVLCCCLNHDQPVKDIIYRFFDLNKTKSAGQHIDCYDLELNNKYYRATIQLIDYIDLMTKDSVPREEILRDCHAIILSVCDQEWSIEQLDCKIDEFKEVGGEPRIILYDGVDEGGSLQDWSIKNGYDLIDATDESVSKQLIDSLSAYRWTYRSDKDGKTTESPKLNEELMQKLADFDSLLGKLSAYRDKPELRGKTDDKNIVEIASLLSGLLGDDVDDFLEAGESSNDKQPSST